jgi:hypothetical protein
MQPPPQVRIGSRMHSTDIVVKTPAGADELKSRSRQLPPRLRMMLILIDGSLNVEQLQQAAAKLSAPPDFVERLLRDGLVALAPVAVRLATMPAQAELPELERFQQARKFMNDTVVDALGIRAFFFSLKLEKCFTRPDLRALLPDYVKAITKGSGGDAAQVLERRARALLE